MRFDRGVPRAMNQRHGPMGWAVSISFGSLLALGCENLKWAGTGEREEESKVAPREEHPESSRQVFTKDDKEVFARAEKARRSFCPALCDRTREAGCSMEQEECFKHCTTLTEKIVCPDQNAAYIACAVSKPAADFECSPAGFATLKGHLCLIEKTAMIACAQAAMAR